MFVQAANLYEHDLIVYKAYMSCYFNPHPGTYIA